MNTPRSTFPVHVHLEPRSVGLGDIVAGITKLFGIKTCAPCEARREILNRLQLNVPSPTVHLQPFGAMWGKKP